MAVLVLDVDGVVIRGHAEGGRWDRHLARDLGIAPAALQEHFFTPHWRAIATGHADMRSVLDAMWHRLDSKTAPHTFVNYWFAADSRLDDDVLAQVDAWRARGNLAYLATVQEHDRADHIWRKLGLANHFDDILYSAALGAAKPDAAFFERAYAELPVMSPDEILFLDDSQKNVEAAAAQGWRARHFRTADDLRDALAEA
jgi:putative hydrolase of the HAD superfamily